MAASRVSGNGQGKCATTLIHLGLGPDSDPAIKTVADQVRMYFHLVAQHGDMLQLSKVWWGAKRRFYTSKNPWGTVTGPIGATIGALITIDWTPVSPLKWVDQNGDVWKYSGQGSLHPLLQAIKDAAPLKIWGKLQAITGEQGLNQALTLLWSKGSTGASSRMGATSKQAH